MLVCVQHRAPYSPVHVRMHAKSVVMAGVVDPSPAPSPTPSDSDEESLETIFRPGSNPVVSALYDSFNSHVGKVSKSAPFAKQGRP